MQQMRSASLLWSPAASALSTRSLESGHLTKQTNLASDGLGEFTVGASEPVSWVYSVALRMNWMSSTASKRCRCHGPLENTTFPSDRQKNAPLISPVRCKRPSRVCTLHVEKRFSAMSIYCCHCKDWSEA